MKNRHDILIGPMLTEKGALMKEQDNKVLFKVAMGANKIEIKRYIKEMFKVDVIDVKIINVRGKKRRMRTQKYGYTASWKKAIVTLKEGDTFDFFEA